MYDYLCYTKTIIEVQNIVKEYTLGGTVFRALRGLNLKIDQGEFVSIVGKSGSGKSTLMHIIGLLDRPSSGSALFAGKETGHLADAELAKLRSNEIGFVFQSFNLLARTSTLDNVLLPAVYTTKNYEVKQKALDLLARVGLSDKLKNTPAQLSGGQQQRVAIARALVNDPSIILADEPTANLDHKTAYTILNLMKKMKDEFGTSFIFSTHDPKIVNEAEVIYTLEDGKIVDKKNNK